MFGEEGKRMSGCSGRSLGLGKYVTEEGKKVEASGMMGKDDVS